MIYFPYTKRYYLTHPHKFVADIWRNMKWTWQRATRGWDDRVVWSIDHHLFEMMPQWLRKLKDTKHGTPIWCFDAVGANWNDEDYSYSENEYELAEKHFDAILEMMAIGFEAGLKVITSDLDIYDEFKQWQIETYGSELDWSLDDDSLYSKARKEFNMTQRTLDEEKLLRTELDVALSLFCKYHDSLWD